LREQYFKGGVIARLNAILQQATVWWPIGFFLPIPLAPFANLFLMASVSRRTSKNKMSCGR
jgi:hypothetical protein